MQRILIVVGLVLAVLVAWIGSSIRPRDVASQPDVAQPEQVGPPEPVGERELDAEYDAVQLRSSAEVALDGSHVDTSLPNAPLQVATRDFYVVNGITRLPVGGLALRAHDDTHSIDVTTDADGGFELSHSLLASRVVSLEVVGPDPPAWQLDPRMVLVVPKSNSRHRSREIRAFARAPALHVDVRDERDVLLPGAVVRLYTSQAGKQSNWPAEPAPALRRAQTDAFGRASFERYEGESGALSVAFVDDERGSVSAPVVIEPNHGSFPTVLRIVPPGSLGVRVVGTHGRALTDFAISAAIVVQEESIPVWQDKPARANVRSRPIPPATYRVSVRHASGDPVLAKEVSVASGAEASVEFVVDAALAERAISGIVVDEAGNPLADVMLAMAPQGGASKLQASEKDGTFVFWHARVARVVLGAVDGDTYAPAKVEADFGTENVVIRRTAVVPVKHLWIRPIDAVTRAPVLDVRLRMSRGDLGMPTEAFWTSPSTSRAAREPRRSARTKQLQAEASEIFGERDTPPDALRISGKFDPTLRWTLTAPGYRRKTGSVAEWSEHFDTDEVIEIALEPGFEARVRLVDKETREPVAGVSCIDSRDHSIVSVSNGGGFATFTGNDPPADGFLLEHPDYYTGTWDPRMRWSESGVIELWRRPRR